MNKLKEFFYSIFKVKPLEPKRHKPKCPNCNSRDQEYGYWTRGWNHLCDQAAGDYGYFCNNCYHVHFLDSKEGFETRNPEWIEAMR